MAPVNIRARSDASGTAAFAVSATIAGTLRKFILAMPPITCSLGMCAPGNRALVALIVRYFGTVRADWNDNQCVRSVTGDKRWRLGVAVGAHVTTVNSKVRIRQVRAEKHDMRWKRRLDVFF